MKISYHKLWKLLREKNMVRTEMRRRAGISTNALAKMGKSESVSLDVLGKVCEVLECNIGDVVECIPDSSERR